MTTQAQSCARYLRGVPAMGALAVLAGLTLFLSTRWGIGVTADSTSYLGLRPHDPGHAPLYGGLMRLAALLPLDVTTAARVYHVVLYAATAVVSWRLLYSATGRASAAWAGALLVAFTSQGLALYSTALSEPTFMFLVVAGIYGLSSWIDTRRPWLLAGAAAAAALATLARYPGVALVGTGALVSFIAGGEHLRRRATRAVLFAAAGLLPTTLWFAYVVRASGSAAGRQAALAGTADAETYYDGLLEATRYLLPTEFPEPARLAALAAALVLLVAATVAFHRRATVRPPSERGAHRYLPLVLLCFTTLYLAVVLLALLVEPYLPISDRYLYPAWVTLVLLGAATIPELTRVPWGRRAVGALVVAFVALSAARAAKTAADGYEQGWAYASKDWRSSPAVAYVNALPSEAVVYSDNPFALIYLTDREVHRLPQEILRRRGAENPNYGLEVEEMRRRLRDTNGVVVIFERSRGPFVMPALSRLRQAVDLEERARFEDAVVYALAIKRPSVKGGYPRANSGVLPTSRSRVDDSHALPK